MECLIFTNGYIDNYEFINLDYKKYYIISCDGGLRHVEKLGIKPNVLIGDFDSVEENLLLKYKDIQKIQYPSDKDFTDTELGIIHAREKGFEKVHIYGATGGRLDHTLGNIFLLKKGKEINLKVVLIDSLQEIYYLDTEEFILNGYKDNTLSIIPFENMECKFSKGLLYPLDDLKFNIGDTRPISNIILDNNVCISVEKGNGLVIITKK